MARRKRHHRRHYPRYYHRPLGDFDEPFIAPDPGLPARTQAANAKEDSVFNVVTVGILGLLVVVGVALFPANKT